MIDQDKPFSLCTITVLLAHPSHAGCAAEEIQSIVTPRQADAISLDTMMELFRPGEVV